MISDRNMPSTCAAPDTRKPSMISFVTHAPPMRSLRSKTATERPLPRQIARRHQSVMAGADHDRIVLSPHLYLSIALLAIHANQVSANV